MFALADSWVHDISPFLWRISGDFGIRWYGLAYVAGFIAAWLMLRRMSAKGLILIPRDAASDVVLAIIIGTLLGGRIGYVLIYRPSLLMEFTADPPWWGLLAINKGGMASHGGMVGIVIACWWSARRLKIPVLHVIDCFCLTGPVGVFFGRIANFINGELLGRIAFRPGEPGAWWAVKFPQELVERRRELESVMTRQDIGHLHQLLHRYALPQELDIRGDGTIDNLAPAAERIVQQIEAGNTALKAEVAPLLSARHPSQLYQALAEGIVVLAVLWWIWRKPRRPGVILAWFGIVYGLGRIITEFWRLPDAQFIHDGATGRIAGLSRGQWMSALMVVIGAGLLAWIVRTRRGTPLGGWATRTARPPLATPPPAR